MEFWQVSPVFHSIFRHEKKVLALVLAFACAFTMFAGAAFTDAADINEDNAEAVELLSALGVIAGYTDGSYLPEKAVTRAEMAKMIYTIRNGGNDDASAYVSVPTSFQDISGHWAEGYIKYLQNTGIVAGKSATKFDPDSTVTTGEAMKMALVLAGYRADKAGLTGTNWINNTLSYATTYGLTKDVKSSISGDCARQDAAQILSNVLYMNAVVWSEFANDFVLDGVGGLGTGVRQTVGFKWMSLIEATGTYTGNDKTNVGLKDGEIAVNVTATTDPDATAAAPLTGPTRATYALDLDWIGEEIKVLYKDANNGTAGLDEKDTVYGVYNTGATTVYNIVKGDLQNTTKADTIKFGDKEYDTVAGNTIDTYVNYVQIADTGAAAYVNGGAYKINSNDAIKFIVDDTTGDIDTAYITTSAFGKISSLTSDKIAIEGLGTKDLEDCDLYEGAAVGDLVQFTELYGTTERVNLIEKAETVTGTISSFKADDAEVQIDGNWYKDAANMATVTDFSRDALVVGNVGDEYELIVDGGYYVAARKISGFSDYALATLGNTEFGNQRMKLLLADGSEVTVTRDTWEDGANATGMAVNDASTGKLFAYNLKSEGTKADLSAKNYNSVAVTAGNGFNGDDDTITAGANTLIVASDAPVFVYYAGTDNKWRAYSAETLSSFSFLVGSNIQYILDDNKIVALAVEASAGFPTGGSNSTAFGYVTGRENTKLGDDNIVKLTVWNGSESVTVNVDGRICNAYVGDFIVYPLVDESTKISNSDIDVETVGTATQGESNLFATVKVKSYNSSARTLITTTETVGAANIVVSGVDTSWSVAADLKVIGVNTADQEGSSMSDIKVYTPATGEDFENAVIVYDEKTGYNEIKAIFVDEDNKLTNYTTGTAVPAAGAAAVVAPTGTAATDRAAINTALAANNAVAVSGDVALDGTALNIGAGKTLTVNGNLTLGAAQTVSGTLIVNGNLIAGANTVTLDNANAAVTVKGNLTSTNANVTVTDGALTVSGTTNIGTGTLTLTDGSLNVQNVTATKVDIDGGTASVGDVTGAVDVAGTATIGDVSGMVTMTNGTATVASAGSVDVSTGTLTLGGVAADGIDLNSGTLNLNCAYTINNTNVGDLTGGTLNIGASQTVTIDASAGAVNVGAVTLKGASRASIIVDASNTVTVAANTMYSAIETATTTPASGTYVWNAAAHSANGAGFVMV